MVLRQSERERRALGPPPAFGGVAVHLRWDPEGGGWRRERQRPPLPAVAVPTAPACDPADLQTAPGLHEARAGGTAARGHRRSPAWPRPPLLVALVGLVLRARALATGGGGASRQGYHGLPINAPAHPVDARPGRT